MHYKPPSPSRHWAYWVSLSPTTLDPLRNTRGCNSDQGSWSLKPCDLDQLAEILDEETDHRSAAIFSGDASKILNEIKSFRAGFPYVSLVVITEGLSEVDQLQLLDKGADYCVDATHPNSGMGLLSAFLDRALKYRRNSEAREAAETALHNAASEVATTAAETFVRMITDHLANTLQIEIAMVGRIGESSQKSLKHIQQRTLALKTTAVSIRGFSSMNTEIPLADSPFQKIYEDAESLFVKDDLERAFPSDLYIQQTGAKSFFGIPLRDSRKQVVGIIAVMDTKPMRNRRLIESTIQIFASRIANEIERSKVNEELKAQASILQQINEGVFTANLDGTITNWNPQAEKLFGYTSNELVGASLRNIMADSSHAEMRQKIIAPVLVSSFHQTEIRLKHRSGREIYCLSNISLEKNSRGNIVGIIFCCTDITEKKLAEARERRAQQRLAFHINRAPLAFIEWDTDFKITAWNPAAEKLFGYQAKEVVGEDFDILDNDQPKSRSLFPAGNRLEQLRTRSKHITENRSKDGRRITCEWMNTPLIDENKTIIGFASLVQDITARVESERSMRRAKEAAEAANRLKNDFLAVMSHEIRTPLNSIIGFTDLLHSIEEDPQKTESLEAIHSNSHELLQLIESVLTYSRIESGEVETHYSEMDLVALVFELSESFGQKAQEKGITLEFEADDSLPELVHHCWDHLRTIIDKILDNAIKFTDSGQIRVFIKGEPKITGSDWHFTIGVEDTGIGISQEKMESLFQVFSQADGTATRKHEGIGLGLAICRRLCDLINASVSLESEDGEGSIFLISFNAAVPDNLPPRSTVDEITHMGDQYPLSILVAEDDENNQILLERLLRKIGYAPVIVSNGAKALEKIHEQAYDLVFMDINMPHMNGLETTEFMRNSKFDKVATTYVCAITAEVHAANRKTCMDAGMNDHITKPIFAGALTEAIQRAHAHKIASPLLRANS